MKCHFIGVFTLPKSTILGFPAYKLRVKGDFCHIQLVPYSHDLVNKTITKSEYDQEMTQLHVHTEDQHNTVSKRRHKKTIKVKQGCGNTCTMPDLSDLVPFHSGQVEIFYLLVLEQVQNLYKAAKILYFIF